MPIAREEVFGPVLSIIPFEGEEEAIRIANDTSYGLSSYVQTGDPERAKRVARQLRSGMVQMNGAGRAAGSPFGRSEEHTSELQSLMRISYAVFCLKKKKTRH